MRVGQLVALVAVGSVLSGCGLEVLSTDPGPGQCRFVPVETAQQILGAQFRRTYDNKSGGCDFVLENGYLDVSVDPAATQAKIDDAESSYPGGEQVGGVGDRAMYRTEELTGPYLLVESGKALVELHYAKDAAPDNAQARMVAMAKAFLKASATPG